MYPHVERGLKQLLIDQIATGVVDGLEVEPETETPAAIGQQQSDVQKERAREETPAISAQGSAETTTIRVDLKDAQKLEAVHVEPTVAAEPKKTTGRGERGRPS